MIREHLGGVIERMEKMRAQALMRSETAGAQAQAYAEVIDELRRLDGIALADEVLRGRVRALDKGATAASPTDEGERHHQSCGDRTKPGPTDDPGLPPSTYDKPQRCTTVPKDDPPRSSVCDPSGRMAEPPPEVGPKGPGPCPKGPAGPSLGQVLREKAAKAEAAKSQEQRKGSPPCPLCQCGTIVVRKTGRLICLNEECPNGQTEQEPDKGKPPAPTPDPEEADNGRAVNIGNGRQDLGEGTNLAACIAAIRYRSPHWLTTSGILEVVRQRLRKDLPETMAQIIGQEMTKQRKLRTFKVPGLQARQVDARRWEYRISGVSKHEGD